MLSFFKQKVKNGMDINEVPIKWRVELSLDPEIQSYCSLTEEDNKKMFELAKELKILESKALLAQYLEAHPIVSDCHGGVPAEYSVTSEKQSLMASNYLIYSIAKQNGLDVELTWNATGEECQVWTEEEFNTLVLEMSAYVKPLVALQQKYEVDIRNCETQEELNAIVISYNVHGVNAEE